MLKDFSLCLRVSVAKRSLGHGDTEVKAYFHAFKFLHGFLAGTGR